MVEIAQNRERQQRQRIQLLGLAFAGADLAFEVDQAGLITFAVGAAGQIAGTSQEQLVGAHWSHLFDASDLELLASLLAGIAPGERQGPVGITLRTGVGSGVKRRASLAVFRLPQNDNGLSCALSLRTSSDLEAIPRLADGLLDRTSFDDAACQIMSNAGKVGQPVRLALVQLDGMDAATSVLDDGATNAARKQVAETLRLESYAGIGATQIATDRFAFLSNTQGSEARLSQRLKAICGDRVNPMLAELNLDVGTPDSSLKALRYALDRFIEDGPASVASSFEAMLDRTAQEAVRFSTVLSAGAFRLNFQPVVDLASNAPHHYEALVRFSDSDDPTTNIRLAEEVGMIVDFDLAIAKRVAEVLSNAEPTVKVAFNVSAISLMTPRFIEALMSLTVTVPKLRRRMLVEITETQKLPDLPKANQVISSLRRWGHAVCLDDFGAGAATLDYLSHLDVDFIKIDGRYIKSLDARSRDAMVLKHVVALCTDLGVSTIAEMVETPAVATAVRELGVEYAQGWLYGRPTPSPTWAEPTPAPAAARRRGVVEQWGWLPVHD